MLSCRRRVAFWLMLVCWAAIVDGPVLASCPIPFLSEISEGSSCLSCAGGSDCQCMDEEDFYFDVYGFGQADYIQDFDRVDPAWTATLRPSRIPTIEGVHGSDGESVISARQSRFGVKANLPTSAGSVRTMLEIDLFGVGVDEGQTTLRLRHAYGEYKNLLGGQTHSLFMDINVFPNVIDYWGPAGMVFLRNPQLRWTPIRGKHTLAFAIEQPSSDIDVGSFDRVIEAFNLDLHGVDRAPNFTWRYRLEHKRVHLQAAGIFRDIGYETISVPPTSGNRPKGQVLGWGVNLSSVITVHERDRIIMQYVFGDGIASYMNDGGVDLAPNRPFPMRADVEAVPLRGLVLYYDHYWNDQWSTSAGYSSTEVDNLKGQKGLAFRRGEYASINLLHYPADSVMYGVEYLWGKRTDMDGSTGIDNRIQVSFKYSF